MKLYGRALRSGTQLSNGRERPSNTRRDESSPTGHLSLFIVASALFNGHFISHHQLFTLQIRPFSVLFSTDPSHNIHSVSITSSDMQNGAISVPPMTKRLCKEARAITALLSLCLVSTNDTGLKSKFQAKNASKSRANFANTRAQPLSK